METTRIAGHAGGLQTPPWESWDPIMFSLNQ
jgi:hypothetical protein